MAVGLQVGPLFYKVGHGDFLHSFFSTIAFHLEKKEWGSRYPILMDNLYNGKILKEDVEKALVEIKEIKKEFTSYSPDKVIWDIENLSKSPPWKNDISNKITTLSNYFITSDGENLFDLIHKSLETARKMKKDVQIRSL